MELRAYRNQLNALAAHSLELRAYRNQLNALAAQQSATIERADPVKALLMQALAAGEFRTAAGAIPWPREITSRDLQASYAAVAAQERHAPEFPSAMKRLRTLLPPGSLRQKKRRQGHGRLRYYQLPDLTAARAHFARVTGITI